MSSGRFRAAAAACLALLGTWACPPAVRAQQGSAEGTTLTLLTAPPAARVALHGTSRLAGPSPLDLPSGWSGRYSARVGAPGYATGQILLAIPSTGEAPYSLSEAPGLSAGLIFRSLNWPGLPDLSSGHEARGLVLTAAAVVGGVAAVRAERTHSTDSKRKDLEARDRAEDDRIYRNRWLGYMGAVWALSALDYVERARVGLLEATPSRVTLGIPRVTRGGILWRSLLVPGAGQEYAGQRSRGLAWLSATLACGAAYVISDFEYERDLSRLSRGEENFAALDSTLKPTYLPALVELRKEADTSRKWRKGFATAAAGFYALNLLDALTVPIRRDDGTGEPRFSLAAPVTPDRAMLQLSYRF
jgi:hypothetical protein